MASAPLHRPPCLPIRRRPPGPPSRPPEPLPIRRRQGRALRLPPRPLGRPPEHLPVLLPDQDRNEVRVLQSHLVLLAFHMVIGTTELPLITVGMKGGAKGLRTLVGTNVGILCQRTSFVPGILFLPVSATSCSRFRTCALIHRNKSLPRSRDSDVGFTGAVCTIGNNYPAKGSWSCRVKPETHNLAFSSVLTCLLFVSMISWEMTRAKKMKRWLALFLLGLCIGVAIYAVKGNETAIVLVTLFDKASKIFMVLGHILTIFGGFP